MRREQSFGLAPGHWAMVEPLAASSMIGDLALMFAVKAWDAVERSVRRNGRRQEMGMSCAELGAERETTVDQALIRGLVTAFRVFVSGLSRSRGRASGASPAT